MRETADWLASEGYYAICPDLFWRIQPGIDITDRSEEEWQKAFSYYRAFNVDTGVEDIAATISLARQNGARKVGAVGYCLGGLLAYLTLTRTDADATVSYYGVGIDSYLGEAARVNARGLLHIAEEDGFVSKDSQARMTAELKPPAFTLYTYPGRDHAFARRGGAHYHAEDAALANARTLDFFRSELKSS
jgi:carboxymethylenebutenolidase